MCKIVLRAWPGADASCLHASHGDGEVFLSSGLDVEKKQRVYSAVRERWRSTVRTDTLYVPCMYRLGGCWGSPVLTTCLLHYCQHPHPATTFSTLTAGQECGGHACTTDSILCLGRSRPLLRKQSLVRLQCFGPTIKDIAAVQGH